MTKAPQSFDLRGFRQPAAPAMEARRPPALLQSRRL